MDKVSQDRNIASRPYDSNIFWHLIIWGMGFGDIGYKPYSYSLTSTAFCLTAFVPAVNCFMFISGWFGIKF